LADHVQEEFPEELLALKAEFEGELSIKGWRACTQSLREGWTSIEAEKGTPRQL